MARRLKRVQVDGLILRHIKRILKKLCLNYNNKFSKKVNMVKHGIFLPKSWIKIHN